MDTVKSLTNIANVISKSGKIAQYFKHSIVTPEYKSGDKTNETHYRPNTLINYISKVLEKNMQSSFIWLTFDLFEWSFYPSRDMILDVTIVLLVHMDVTKVFFLDLTKAVDTVPH